MKFGTLSIPISERVRADVFRLRGIGKTPVGVERDRPLGWLRNDAGRERSEVGSDVIRLHPRGRNREGRVGVGVIDVVEGGDRVLGRHNRDILRELGCVTLGIGRRGRHELNPGGQQREAVLKCSGAARIGYERECGQQVLSLAIARWIGREVAEELDLVVLTRRTCRIPPVTKLEANETATPKDG